jgi:hypothetical protein
MMNKEEAKVLMDTARHEYHEWRNQQRKNLTGFFVIYNTFKDSGILKNISGNACRLYVYLGIVSKNETGESWYSADSIAEYFDCDKRSVKRWFEELEEEGLIIRVQKGVMRAANTFLKPY